MVVFMKKFKFELQGVLDIKTKLEGQAKMNFGSAVARLNREEAERDAIGARRSEYEERLKELMEGPLDVKGIAHCRSGIETLTEQYDAKQIVCRRAEKQVEVCRGRLNTAMRERKTIEKLREKRFDEYIAEYNSEENKAVDELVSFRHGTAMKQGENDG